MLSGMLAAEQAMRCFRQNDMSAGFMKQYDAALQKKLGKELKDRYRAQRLLSRFPFLLDIIFFAGRNRYFLQWIQKRCLFYKYFNAMGGITF
jgi:flavin-dependent dehydrogenase